jgi:hypothetical protein
MLGQWLDSRGDGAALAERSTTTPVGTTGMHLHGTGLAWEGFPSYKSWALWKMVEAVVVVNLARFSTIYIYIYAPVSMAHNTNYTLTVLASTGFISPRPFNCKRINEIKHNNMCGVAYKLDVSIRIRQVSRNKIKQNIPESLGTAVRAFAIRRIRGSGIHN